MLQLLYMLLSLILSLIGAAVLAGSATSLIMGSAVGLGTALGGGVLFAVLTGIVSIAAWVLAIVAAIKAYGYTAVSYTHLDVYKRQGMIHGRKPQLPSDTVKDGALRFAHRTLAAIGLKLCLIPLPGLG